MGMKAKRKSESKHQILNETRYKRKTYTATRYTERITTAAFISKTCHPETL
jgi:hypothetical protein